MSPITCPSETSPPCHLPLRPLTLFLIPDFLASCITMAFAAKCLPGFLLSYSTVINEFVANGSKSSWSDVISGVPHGTVLGSLFFLLYINDISGNIQSNIRLFTDDCIVYRTIRSQDDSCKLQNDISSLLRWAETWQMRFNSEKCHILSITRQRNKFSSVYYLGTDVLSTVSSHTYLDIVSSDLKWHEHISNICLKATRTLNFVRRNTYCCSQEAKNLAYLSLVRPNLEYAAAA